MVVVVIMPSRSRRHYHSAVAVMAQEQQQQQDEEERDDMNDDDDDAVDMNKRKQKKKPPLPPNVILAHIRLDSRRPPEQAHKSAGLPQTISAKKAHRLADQTAIQYYAGNTARSRMHICSGNNDESDYYVWYAHRGPDLKRDGYYLQVFQINRAASMQDLASVANALQQYGELDEDNPFVRLDNAQILSFLWELQQQRTAWSRQGGLRGVHVYLYAWKRWLSRGMTTGERTEAVQEAQTRAAEPGGFFQATTRLRVYTSTITTTATTTTSDADQQDHPPGIHDATATTESYDYIIVEEDSDLGHLYDNTVGWWINKVCWINSNKNKHTTTTTCWAREWGRQAIYKFVTGTDPASIKAGIRAYCSGKTNTRRLERLLQTVWPKPEEQPQKQQQQQLEPEQSADDTNHQQEHQDKAALNPPDWRESVEMPDAAAGEEL